jgi:diadenylate cyclase
MPELLPSLGALPHLLTDIADVLIVAFVFYRLLLLLKGTRAMQMAIGLAVVIMVYHAARRLGLVTLYTILDALLTYSVLVVVLFQSDIRRMLSRVGQRSWFRAGSNARDVHAIEEVVKTAVHLGQRHIGALIVFERDAALDEFVENGTPMDSAISKELLYSLFVPSADNPLHDGAVVVRDGKVWQAGVLLPLSASARLDRSLGTRHRAAIGISEETDAVVVVVSEERGSISLCFNGNMARGLDGGSLRQALLGLFQTATRKKPAAPREPAAARPRTLSGERTSGHPAGITEREKESTP